MERAIRLHAEDAESGIQAQHEWIQKNLPGAHFPEPKKLTENEDDDIVYFAHRTMASEKAIFSVYTLELPDGSIRDVYFDMSEYFGKFKMFEKAPNQQVDKSQ